MKLVVVLIEGVTELPAHLSGGLDVRTVTPSDDFKSLATTLATELTTWLHDDTVMEAVPDDEVNMCRFRCLLQELLCISNGLMFIFYMVIVFKL